MYELAVSLATDIVGICVPIAIVFEITNIIVSTFLRVAFGGRFYIGK